MAELVGAGNGSVSHSLVLVSSDEPLVVSARCAVCIRIVYVHVRQNTVYSLSFMKDVVCWW